MSDWQTKRLGDILQLKYGKSLSVKNRVEGPIPVYGSNGIVGSHSEAIVDVPGLIVGRKGSAGQVHRSLGPFCPIDTTFYVTAADAPDTDLEFLFYLLRHIDLTRITGDVGVPGMNREMAYMEKVHLPAALPEQKKIAHILSMVQRAIETQERIIQNTTELKKALMHKLFTEGLRNEPEKQTEIGPVPESWEVVRFEDSVSIKNGQVDPREAPFADMLHVGSENIESDTGRLVKLQTNAELKISSGNYHFTPEDVLYSKIRPYLNKVALPDSEGTCSADMYPLRSSSHFTREFLFYYLLSDDFKKEAISFQDRTGIPKINRMQLGTIRLPCPSKGEQHEITAALASCDGKVNVTQRKREALQDLFLPPSADP
ncbi:MAG: restriction endonuclease subunit S [Candidatus Accumulibacter necessarius]|uniref:restriction endonuclease subunit S n=1 Tax=Candidatus Accumulibacter necessarius TaxID=2954386 RepID=UPI002FC2C6B4